MDTINATEVRKEWSSAIDSVVRNRPMFIKRTRDYIVMSDTTTMEMLLEVYEFSAKRYREEDGSVTLSLQEIDLVENGQDEIEARRKLAVSIMEYAKDFYAEYSIWSKAPNRKSHIPYVLKVLMIDDIDKIEDIIVCRDGDI